MTTKPQAGVLTFKEVDEILVGEVLWQVAYKHLLVVRVIDDR